MQGKNLMILGFVMLFFSCDSNQIKPDLKSEKLDENIIFIESLEKKEEIIIYDCDQISDIFSSYEEANQKISNANYRFKDFLITSKSSWIKGANFYSCDGEVGYLFLKTNNKTYIHKQVPLSVWEQFKRANSYGKYYNSYIKNRYRFSLE